MTICPWNSCMYIVHTDARTLLTHLISVSSNNNNGIVIDTVLMWYIYSPSACYAMPINQTWLNITLKSSFAANKFTLNGHWSSSLTIRMTLVFNANLIKSKVFLFSWRQLRIIAIGFSACTRFSKVSIPHRKMWLFPLLALIMKLTNFTVISI